MRSAHARETGSSSARVSVVHWSGCWDGHRSCGHTGPEMDWILFGRGTPGRARGRREREVTGACCTPREHRSVVRVLVSRSTGVPGTRDGAGRDEEGGNVVRSMCGHMVSLCGRMGLERTGGLICGWACGDMGRKLPGLVAGKWGWSTWGNTERKTGDSVAGKWDPPTPRVPPSRSMNRPGGSPCPPTRPSPADHPAPTAHPPTTR